MKDLELVSCSAKPQLVHCMHGAALRQTKLLELCFLTDVIGIANDWKGVGEVVSKRGRSC